MQRQTVLVVVAVLAAVATALWLWPSRPATPRPVAATAVAPAPAPVLATPAAPAPSAPAVAVAVAVAPPPAPPVEDAKPAPAPLAVPPPPHAAPSKREIAAPVPTDAAPVTAEGVANDADGSDEAVDSGESAPAAAIDEDHAIDLFAERMTALEQGGDEADRNDASQQKTFDGRSDGGEDAATRTRELRAHLQAWIAALPPDHPHEVLLASVECRDGGCRVLVAEGGVDLSGQAETPGNAAVNSLQESFLALHSADWWQQLRLGEASLSMHAADPATAPGYVLWTIYIDVAAASGADASAGMP